MSGKKKTPKKKGSRAVVGREQTENVEFEGTDFPQKRGELRGDGTEERDFPPPPDDSHEPDDQSEDDVDPADFGQSVAPPADAKQAELTDASGTSLRDGIDDEDDYGAPSEPERPPALGVEELSVRLVALVERPSFDIVNAAPENRKRIVRGRLEIALDAIGAARKTMRKGLMPDERDLEDALLELAACRGIVETTGMGDE